MFCSLPRRGARPAQCERAIWGRGRAAPPPGCSPTHLPDLRTHSDARRNAKRCGNCGYSVAVRAARINSGPAGGRYTGSTGLAGSPRRSRIMEGPLVSDTSELLNGASTASEDAPVGTSAPTAAAAGPSEGDLGSPGATAPASKSRSRSGTGLSSLLMPELQRIAQTMGIPGAGRMRKGQLVEAIEARQGSQTPPQEPRAAHQGSDQRAASAGADASRLRKQDAMEPDTYPQPGIGAAAGSGIGDSARGGIGADGAGQQQLAFDEAAGDRARRDGEAQRTANRRAETKPTDAKQADAPYADVRQGDAPHADVQQGDAPHADAQAGTQATGAAQDDGPAGDTAAEAPRGDRRRRTSRRDEQSPRGREPSGRDQTGRDQSRDQGGRDQGGRDPVGRDQVGRDQGRDQGARDQGGRDQGGRDQGRDQGA